MVSFRGSVSARGGGLLEPLVPGRAQRREEWVGKYSVEVGNTKPLGCIAGTALAIARKKKTGLRGWE